MSESRSTLMRQGNTPFDMAAAWREDCLWRAEQKKLWRPDDHPDGPQRGDCMRACYASILGIPLRSVPRFEGYVNEYAEWVKTILPGVALRHLDVSGNQGERETPDSWKTWPERHFEPGYWIAGVYSLRIPDVEVFGCGCTERIPGGDPDCEWCHGKPETRHLGMAWGLHAVVMRGWDCVWDPHPHRDQGFGPFRSATTFAFEDPLPMAQKFGVAWKDGNVIDYDQQAFEEAQEAA